METVSTSKKKQQSRYQVVPAVEDDDDDDETNSLYSSPSHAISPTDEETSSLVSLRHPLAIDVVPLNDSNGMTPSTTPKSLSRANSSVHDNDDGNDDTWDLDDEENLQRYNFVYNTTPAPPPQTKITVATHWNQLRSSARQRRAARLLSMRDSWYHRLSVGFLNVCCDATDTGIALAAILLLLWVILGGLFHAKSMYWILGVLFFAVRVSARRVIECFGGRMRADSWKRSNHGSLPIPSGEQEVV